jgi:flagellar motor protein MotB
VDEAYNFWPAYSDLALSLLLILILFLLAQYVFNSRLLVDQDIGRVRTRVLQADLRRQLVQERGIVSVAENGNLQIITLSGDFLFASDAATLTVAGTELLTHLGAIFLRNQTRITRLAIEGHADDQRSIRFYETGDLDDDHGNWRLSSERAIRVVQLLQARGLDGQKLEAIGRSKYEPVDTSFLGFADRPQSPEYKASLRTNRRIVIRLFYSERDPQTTR